MKQRIPIALLLLLTACAANSYVTHPGSVSRADSLAFDSLLIAQAVIEQARMEFNTGTLPESFKEPLNRLIESYNVARESWLMYRNAVKAGGTASESAMQATITALNRTLTAFQSARPIP